MIKLAFGEIYKLTFPNGKSYIGATTVGVESRFKRHATNAKTRNAPLYQAWREMGPPELDVLDMLPVKDLDEAERAAIIKFGTMAPGGYNELPGGKVSPMTNPEIAKRVNEKATRTKRLPEIRAKYAEATRRAHRKEKGL